MSIKILQGEIEKARGIHYEYDIDSTPIGEGGMGVVYRGVCVNEHTGVRTEVAIKALHEDLPDEVYARAEREASIQLRHDNLVEMLGLISVLETNRWGDAIYHHYVISEFLHGIELSDVLKGNLDGETRIKNEFACRLSQEYQINREKTSVFIIRSILSGVMALHDKGFIHRDIDPSNIMVTEDGCIKLIDFGIAKDLKSLGSTDKMRTATGKFIGKAEYASPELVLGDVMNHNYTTDVYALGILLYQLLVGQLPFLGSQYEVLQKQLKQKLPVKNIKNSALAKVVKKATEKRQGDRFGSIPEFRVALDAALSSRMNNWNSYGKYAAILVGVGVLATIAWSSIQKEENPIHVPTPHERYIKALALLDSNIEDSARVGFGMMRILADEGYDSAQIEVGITYFAGAQKGVIPERRKKLGFTNNNITPMELDSTIHYLSAASKTVNLTPEVHYILGSAYYSKDNKNIEPVIKSFSMALDSLKAGQKASHGYDSQRLQEVLDFNINQLKK